MTESRRAGDPRPRFSEWLMGPIRVHRGIYLRVALAAVAVNLLGFASSLFSMTIYDRVIPNNAMSSLVALAIGVGIVIVFDFALRQLRSYFVDMAGARIDQRIGAGLFDRLIAMRLDRRRLPAGVLSGLMREMESLREFFASATLVALVDLPFILLALLVIWLIGGAVVWAPVLAVLLVVAVGLATQPAMRRLSHANLRDALSRNSVFLECIAGLETVQAAGGHAFMRRRWKDASAAHAASGLRQRFIAAFATTAAGSAQTCAYVGVVIIGAVLAGGQSISTGAIIACSILSGRAIAPLGSIAQLLTRLHATGAAYRQIDRLMAADEQPGRAIPSFSPGRIAGQIELRQVGFRFEGCEQPALAGLSCTIEAGQRVALIGRIGSGKSTLARLVAGLIAPSEGQILVDGLDIRSYNRAELRREMGVMLQDSALFSGSVAENIALGRNHVDDAEVLRAATVAGAHRFLQGAADGYRMRLSDLGEGVSGGQRQSLSLARALAGRPRIVILDEPTSAMDMLSERELIESLRAELNGRTLLLVTHRPQLLSLVDRVIQIEQGRIVADAPRDQFLAAQLTRVA